MNSTVSFGLQTRKYFKANQSIYLVTVFPFSMRSICSCGEAEGNALLNNIKLSVDCLEFT